MSIEGDSFTLTALVHDHLGHLEARNYASSTIRNRRSNLRLFCRWCGERGVIKPNEVSRPVVERYREWLFHYRQDDARPLSWSDQINKLTAVKMYLRWMVQLGYLLYSPAAELEMPRQPRSLPQAVLTRSEVEQVINTPDVSEPLGVRDRAILEILYSTGIRRMEIVGLRLEDLDAGREVMMIRQGKGGKDRVVPIGDRALAWIDRYLLEVRPRLIVPPDPRWLFINDHGHGFSLKRMGQLCHNLLVASGVGRPGACHIFRHTAATHMLEGGADIRYIQQLLGHEQLSTTQIYTRVSIRQLQKVHRQTHPARLGRAEAVDVSEQTEREQLEAALAAEAAGEDRTDSGDRVDVDD